MEFLTKLKNFILTKHFFKHVGLIILTYIIVVGGMVLILDSMTNHGQKIKVPSLFGKNVKNPLQSKSKFIDSLYICAQLC